MIHLKCLRLNICYVCSVYQYYLGHDTSKNIALCQTILEVWWFFFLGGGGKRRKALIMLIYYLSEYDIQGGLFALYFFF